MGEYDSVNALSDCMNPSAVKHNASQTSNDNECTLVTDNMVKVYARMDKCVSAGQVIGQSTFCVATSTAPTMPSVQPTIVPTHTPTLRPTGVPTQETDSPTSRPTEMPTAMLDGELFAGISRLTAICIGGGVCGVCLIGMMLFCCVRNIKMRRSFGNDEGEMMAGYQEYVLQMENENQEPVRMHLPSLPESIAMDSMDETSVTVGDQQIIGTADEINIVGADIR